MIMHVGEYVSSVRVYECVECVYVVLLHAGGAKLGIHVSMYLAVCMDV